MSSTATKTEVLPIDRLEEKVRQLVDVIDGLRAEQAKTADDIAKLEQDLEERIEVKNQETFNEELLDGLKKELKEYEALITSTALKLGEELE